MLPLTFYCNCPCNYYENIEKKNRSSWIAFECEALCCVQNLDSTEDTKAVTVKKKPNLVVRGHIPVYFHKFVIDCTFFKRSHLIMNLHVDSRNI